VTVGGKGVGAIELFSEGPDAGEQYVGRIQRDWANRLN